MSTVPAIDQLETVMLEPAQAFQPAKPATEDLVWLNGRYMLLSEARVPIEDRGYQFGDGIYEVLITYDGVPFLTEYHMERWERSAAGLRITPKFSRQERVEVINKLVDKLGARRAIIYGQLTRGTAKRIHNFPENIQPFELWYARELAQKPPHLYTEGVAAVTHPDERWKHVWIKSTCLLPNCMAKQYAMEHDAFDSILFTHNCTITESSAANVFVVNDGIIWTHPANGRILAGATRGLVLELAKANGMLVCEEPFSLHFLRSAQEVFLTSTTINVLPVTTLDNQPVGNGKVGPKTQQLMVLIGAEIKKRSSR
jgi:D-alanine transaminase